MCKDIKVIREFNLIGFGYCKVEFNFFDNSVEKICDDAHCYRQTEGILWR
jgi:hypothetical protein